MAAPGLPQPAYHAPAPAAPLAVPQPVAPAYHAPPAAAVAPPPVQAGPTRAEWTAGCNRIIDNIVKNLGPVDSPIFYEPVDPKLVGARHLPRAGTQRQTLALGAVDAAGARLRLTNRAQRACAAMPPSPLSCLPALPFLPRRCPTTTRL